MIARIFRDALRLCGKDKVAEASGLCESSVYDHANGKYGSVSYESAKRLNQNIHNDTISAALTDDFTGGKAQFLPDRRPEELDFTGDGITDWKDARYCGLRQQIARYHAEFAAFQAEIGDGMNADHHYDYMHHHREDGTWGHNRRLIYDLLKGEFRSRKRRRCTNNGHMHRES